MLSMKTAEALREAGLEWTPALLDFFTVPYAGLENQVFVLSDMTVMAEPIRSRLAITFHGTVEWALDHVWVGEALWIPREDQLRELLEEWLLGEPQPALILRTTQLGYACEIQFRRQQLSFEGFEASEAYAAALLHVMAVGTHP